MKKALVSALTTALVVGAASTTFAAANPFSDVPADHWAYDAVSQLAADGVIEGYGDTTFKGNRNITRYEMAQMVAKAMAKNTSGVDKALVDKLAAEFAEELNNLGVRVANLERNADMVKWNGEARYTYKHDKTKYNDGTSTTKSSGPLLLRLEPTAEVNDHWKVKARLDATTYANNDSGINEKGEDDSKVTLKRIWAQGNYGKFQVKLGKFAQINNDTIADTTFSGVELSYGKGIKGIIGVGRINKNSLIPKPEQLIRKSGSYQYVGVQYASGKYKGGLAWHHVKAHDGDFKYKNDGNSTDQMNIIIEDDSYQFDKNIGVKGFYAYNKNADIQKKAGRLELDYKGAQKENKGTWGAWIAYSHLGKNAMIANPWDVVKPGEKGWEIGGNYTFLKNVVGTLRYGKTKDIDGTGKKYDHFFGRVQFFF